MTQFTDWNAYLGELRRVQANLAAKSASEALLQFVADLISLVEHVDDDTARSYYRNQPPAILMEAEEMGVEIPPPPPKNPPSASERHP